MVRNRNIIKKIKRIYPLIIINAWYISKFIFKIITFIKLCEPRKWSD